MAYGTRVAFFFYNSTGKPTLELGHDNRLFRMRQTSKRSFLCFLHTDHLQGVLTSSPSTCLPLWFYDPPFVFVLS